MRFMEWDVAENKCKFNMSHEAAVELHIKDSDFEKIISDIEVANNTIKKWSSIPNKKCSITKPEDGIKRILQRDSKFNWWEPESVSQERSGEKSTEHEVNIITHEEYVGGGMPMQISQRI